jgi:hypothetical protein
MLQVARIVQMRQGALLHAKKSPASVNIETCLQVLKKIGLDADQRRRESIVGNADLRIIFASPSPMT